MAIDFTKERLIRLADVPNFIVRIRPGRKPNRDTIRRWVRDGCKGGIRLESAWIGGMPHTSEEALKRFFASLAAVRKPADVPRIRGTREMSRGHQKAVAELDAAGW